MRTLVLPVLRTHLILEEEAVVLAVAGPFQQKIAHERKTPYPRTDRRRQPTLVTTKHRPPRGPHAKTPLIAHK